jgi:hypothetical protein
MAKNLTKARGQWVALVLIIGAPLYGIYLLGEVIVNAMGWEWFVGSLAAIAAGSLWVKWSSEKAARAEARKMERDRRDALLKKYGDEKR